MEPFRCRDPRSGVRYPVLAYRSEEMGRQIRRLERVIEAPINRLMFPGEALNNNTSAVSNRRPSPAAGARNRLPAATKRRVRM